MDDFLYNLRTGNLRRGDADHRQSRGSQYKGPQRRSGGDRRQAGPDLSILSDQLTAIEKSLKSIANEQRRIADAAEREADALDLIAHWLQREQRPVADPNEPAEPVTASLAEMPPEDSIPEAGPTDKMGREEILDLVKQLRSKKMSYAKIAEHLDEKGIATLSGRGKWYATTISKLLQHEEELT